MGEMVKGRHEFRGKREGGEAKIIILFLAALALRGGEKGPLLEKSRKGGEGDSYLSP